MSNQMKHYIFLAASSAVLLFGYSNCSFQNKNAIEPVKTEKVMPSSGPTDEVVPPSNSSTQ